MPDSHPDISTEAAPGLLRVLASLFYDSVLVIGLVLLVFTVLYIPLEQVTGNTSLNDNPLGIVIAIQLALVATPPFFHVWFWVHGGQTLGMKTWRLKLVTEEGQPVSTGAALVRYFSAVLSWLPLGLGFFWILIDKENRSWHDKLSGTKLLLLPKQK
ncbi:MAG: RDD family protein [bacterium]